MIDLRRFFELIFDTREISDDKMRAFSEDHLGRIAANNTANQYDTMLNDTEAAHTAYFGAIDNEATLLALQQSRTVSTDNAMEAFKKDVSQQEGAVRAKYGKDAPEYEEFFPQGLTEYTVATKLTIESLMTRILNAFTAHQADLGAALVTLFTTLRTNYITARGAQLVKKGEVTASKSVTQTTRDALERQLQNNLMTLAIEFMGNPDRGMDFFDQSIYRRDTVSDEEILGTVQNTVAANMISNAGTLPAGTQKIRMTAMVNGPLEFYLTIDGLTRDGNSTALNAPNSTTYTIADFASAGTSMAVKNQNLTLIGEYKIEFLA